MQHSVFKQIYIIHIMYIYCTFLDIYLFLLTVTYFVVHACSTKFGSYSHSIKKHNSCNILSSDIMIIIMIMICKLIIPEIYEVLTLWLKSNEFIFIVILPPSPPPPPTHTHINEAIFCNGRGVIGSPFPFTVLNF